MSNGHKARYGRYMPGIRVYFGSMTVRHKISSLWTNQGRAMHGRRLTNYLDLIWKNGQSVPGAASGITHRVLHDARRHTA